MALVQFTPTVRLGTAGAAPVFLDAACTQRAQVFDLNGSPLPGNVVVIDDNGVSKPFQVNTVTTVYFRHASQGVVISHTSAGVAAIVSAASKSATFVTEIKGI